MNNVSRRIKKLEKSIQPAPKDPPVFLFVSPGETAEQRILKYESEHGKAFNVDYDCIIRFATEEDHVN